MQAHDLIRLGRRLVGLDEIDALALEVLDQLGARCFALDYHVPRIVGRDLFDHLAFEIGIIETLPQDMEQIIMTVIDAQVVQTLWLLFAAFVRCIPALDDTSEVVPHHSTFSKNRQEGEPWTTREESGSRTWAPDCAFSFTLNSCWRH